MQIERRYHDNGALYNVLYLSKNKRHRIGAPADISYNPDGVVIREAWWKKNMRHRIDGPALIFYNEKDGTVEREYYWIDDCPYTDFEWEMYHAKTDEERMLIKLRYS